MLIFFYHWWRRSLSWCRLCYYCWHQKLNWFRLCFHWSLAIPEVVIMTTSGGATGENAKIFKWAASFRIVRCGFKHLAACGKMYFIFHFMTHVSAHREIAWHDSLSNIEQEQHVYIHTTEFPIWRHAIVMLVWLGISVSRLKDAFIVTFSPTFYQHLTSLLSTHTGLR